MTKRKILALILTLALIFTQFSMLGVVSAETTALTGREDFLMGVNIHPSKGYSGPYVNTYSVIKDAKALGSNIIRTNFNLEDNHSYDLGVAELAMKNGMKVWMTTSFSYLDEETGELITPDAAYRDSITEKYTNAATVLKDKVAYYQLGNEMNIKMHTGSSNGLTADQFADCSGIAVAIYAANKAIKDIDLNAKTVVNFSWQHMGFIDAIKAVKLDADTGLPATSSTTNITYAEWDIIGLNWYSDGKNSDFKIDGKVIDYDYIIESLNEKYPYMPVVISEAGLYPVENEDGSVGYIGDADWLETFLKYCYENENVVGFIPYELYDQDSISYDEEGNYTFNKEAHFGLMHGDRTKKDVYNTICSLYGGTGFVDRATAENTPTKNNAGELVTVFSDTVSKATVRGVYEETILTVDSDSAVDFSKGNFIEFDFYVENVSDFKSAMKRNDLNLSILAYDSSETFRDCRYIADEYILVDGWNHITVSRDAFYDGTVDWSDINKIDIKFYGSSAILPTYTEISGMNVAVANICSTKISAPANVVDEGKQVIDELGYSIPANRVVGYYPGWQGKTLASPINVSSYNRIEFDFYVENLGIFQKLTSERELVLKLLGNTDGTIQRQYYLSQYVTKQGWNHIIINIDNYNAHSGTWNNSIAKYRLHFNGGEFDKISYPATYFAFKNFNALLGEWNVLPGLPENANKIVCRDGYTFDYGLNKRFKYSDATPKVTFDGVNISDSDYVEFDLYLENADLFKEYITNNPNYAIVYLTIYTNGITKFEGSGVRADLPFTDKINSLVDGWNHIKIAKSSAVSRGASNANKIAWSNVTGIAFTTGDYTCPSSGTAKARIANVCGTLADYKVSPELPANAIASSAEKVINVYGNVMSNINNIKTTFEKPIDLSNADYIEFDLYVENAEHFKTYCTTNAPYDAHYFYFYLITSKIENNSNVKATYYFKNMLDQITVDGWNRIKIAKGDWGHIGFSGTPEFSSVIGAGWNFKREAANSLYTTEHIGFANVCGTVDLTIPTEVMAEKIDFIGATLNQIKFDSLGEYAADLEKAVNISGEQMMIELDVYVSGNAFTELEVELADKAGGYVVYSFEGLISGWNHLAIRLSDSIEGGVDFANIVGYAFYGTANNSIIVSNFYAAAYVKGDGNRDGIMDIRDLVAMKKYSVGLALSSGMVGNKVAMDVAGNDYNVNSLDLSELRRYFLTDKWSEN